MNPFPQYFYPAGHSSMGKDAIIDMFIDYPFDQLQRKHTLSRKF